MQKLFRKPFYGLNKMLVKTKLPFFFFFFSKTQFEPKAKDYIIDTFILLKDIFLHM